MKTTGFFIFFFALSLSAFADGSIEGVVRYDGIVPHEKLVHMDADPICYAIHKGNVHAPALNLGEHNTLGDVFVYVKSGLANAQYPPPSEPALITQAGCNYAPHVLGVMIGQKVKFLNPDGTMHNVHVMSKVNPEFNGSMPEFRKEMEAVFNKPELMFPVRCDVHPWMLAWIAVMPHPYFAVTKADGHFAIKGLAAGTYEIEVWQEKLGRQSATITVKDGASQKIDFTFSPPK